MSEASRQVGRDQSREGVESWGQWKGSRDREGRDVGIGCIEVVEGWKMKMERGEEVWMEGWMEGVEVDVGMWDWEGRVWVVDWDGWRESGAAWRNERGRKREVVMVGEEANKYVVRLAGRDKR